VSDPDVDAAQAGMDRRALVTKLAVGAFAVPAIVAFKLDSLARAGGFSNHPRHPDCTQPNGTQPDGQTPPPEDDDDPRKKKKDKKEKKGRGHGH
jgi:hypothetical protein